jgi:hypothetical protein
MFWWDEWMWMKMAPYLRLSRERNKETSQALLNEGES